MTKSATRTCFVHVTQEVGGALNGRPFFVGDAGREEDRKS